MNTTSTQKITNLLKVIIALFVISMSACQGPKGDPGPTGPQGATGTTGATGATGAPGTNGNTIDYGTTAPTAATGNNGDFYINTATDFIYGPKANGAWPAGTSLVGPQGAMGATGASGNTIDYGTTAPTASTGNNGDFYINTTTNFIYGPKANGAWPAGISIIGPTGIAGSTADSLSVGLIAFYPFNGNTLDYSGNHYDGTLSLVAPSPITDRFGNQNGAFAFNGSYVSVADNAALRLANTDYTINFWVNVQAYSPNNQNLGMVISKVSQGYDLGYFAGIYAQPGAADVGQVYWQQGDGGVGGNGVRGQAYQFLFSNESLNLGVWHMVTLVYTQNNTTMRIFIDGLFSSSTIYASAINPSTNPLYIGYDPGNYDFLNPYLDAYLDDIRIYNQAISYSRIRALQYDTSNE